jgi:hypothetical protein
MTDQAKTPADRTEVPEPQPPDLEEPAPDAPVKDDTDGS